jgi:transposase
MKYTIHDLLYDFPDEKSCLIWLFEFRYPEGVLCAKCLMMTKHYLISGRKVFSCGKCGNQINPLLGTIFYKSRVPLRKWFLAIYQIATHKAGVSAKQVQRELGVTYKTAWRMMHEIRKMMGNTPDLLDGEFEIDETFIHPNSFKRSSVRKKYGYDMRRSGEVVFGILQRNGCVRVWHVRGTGVRVLLPIIERSVVYGSTIHTDGYGGYRCLTDTGYNHHWTDHGKGEYWREDSYTQNIENFWSHFKRGIKGVYRHIGKGYIQLYANEYAWRYSNRKRECMFWSLMSRVV